MCVYNSNFLSGRTHTFEDPKYMYSDRNITDFGHLLNSIQSSFATSHSRAKTKKFNAKPLSVYLNEICL